MPPLYRELCQSGVGQQTTPEQGDNVASQQKTLCLVYNPEDHHWPSAWESGYCL